MLGIASAALVSLVLAAPPVRPVDGNRLAYLDELNPWYPHRDFPKLVTPQWVGEEGVEAVVILGIDDMRGHEKWEAYLRPILDRLKKIDGRAPVSIMTCQIDPQEPHLQKWLKEGLSLECHTIDHPCPLLGKMNLAEAKSTYDRCVDQMFAIPGSRPVAFRMPCCDSLNTVSPRFFAEIFNKATPRGLGDKIQGGNFLTIDSSVFCLLTPNDPALPRELVLEKDGTERFRKYLPGVGRIDNPSYAGATFVNTIEDYPYPYVIGKTCWEFPCTVPSDWAAQHLHKPNNPKTVEDWKAALDAVVIKQGVFCLVFHPHNWIRPEQVNELIDHAVAKHGKKVKFLTFREAQQRLDKVFGSLRFSNHLEWGTWAGQRLLDTNHDGYLDTLGSVWEPGSKKWKNAGFPFRLSFLGVSGPRHNPICLGVVRPDGKASVLEIGNAPGLGVLWHMDGTGWGKDEEMLRGVEDVEADVRYQWQLLRDIDGDGRCELIGEVAGKTPGEYAVITWTATGNKPRKLPFGLRAGVKLDAACRLVDIDEDGDLDIVFSNAERYGIYLFEGMDKGWSRKVIEGERAKGQNEIPPFVRADGTNNGAWIANRHIYWQNEDTGRDRNLPDLIDRRSFNELLKSIEPAPKSAEASLRCLKARPGFQVELVAAEPLVMDPVGFEWGPDGKLWVVEMADYPLGLDDKGKPGGRIKYLEDTDGDGRYDKATLFLDGIPFPSDVMPWRKGVLVTAAPDIFYAEDTDGDGRADKRVVLFTGFAEGNQQHRVNGLRWGLDGWVYVANGDSAGRVKAVGRIVNPSEKPVGRISNPSFDKDGRIENPSYEDTVELGGRDLRIRPDDGAMELVSGRTQHGRCRDDWGNWFGANNATLGWHYALDDHYLRRNPFTASPDPRSELTSDKHIYPRGRPISHWEGYRPPPEGQPGVVTSACGHCIYRDELFGSAYAGNLFMSEVVHNLVHRMILEPKGSTFTARRAADEQRSEFLASSDSWFRPTTLKTGPDGALWVADMYRLVIEHPQWIDRNAIKQLNLRAGHDKGRIYRVFPVGAKPRPIPRLDKLDAAGLVAALDSPSGWQRDMVQQMLLWRHNPFALRPLEDLAAESKRPEARGQALATLGTLKHVMEPVLIQALADPHPGVRRQAAWLCEPRLQRGRRASTAPDLPEKLVTALLKLADDPDPQVRLQLAYALGEWSDPRAAKTLVALAARDDRDPFLDAAVMSSAPRHVGGMLEAALAGPQRQPELVAKLLGLAVAMKNEEAVAVALEGIAASPSAERRGERLAQMATFLEVLGRRNTSLAQFRQQAGPRVQQALAKATAVLDEARRTVPDAKAPLDQRVAAIGLLAWDDDRRAADVKTLIELLAPQTPVELQLAAVASLVRLDDPKVAAELFGRWKTFGPRLRSTLLDGALTRPRMTHALLERLQAGKLSVGELDAATRDRLRNHPTPTVRAAAAILLGKATESSRADVIAKYRPAARAGGDMTRGLAVYKKVCANCHRLGDVGVAVGPDLATMADRSPETILTAVLDPNRAVEARYQSYSALLADGRTLTGMLASESGGSITLLAAEGKRHEIARADLERLESSGKSLMPEGIEKDLLPQDLADVIAYLGRHRAPRRQFPGNEPQVVRPTGESDAMPGSLHLTAVVAEIYGQQIVFEQPFKNLGYWSGPQDHALWRIDLPKAGRYEVWLDWACDKSAAGNRYVLQAGEQTITGRVESTGTWETYRRARIGTLDLPEGKTDVIFRPGDGFQGTLIDLRAIQLLPRSGK